MSKICNYNGCNNEIQEWQQMCSTHYAMMMQKQNPTTTQQPTPVQNVQPPDMLPEMKVEHSKSLPLPKLDERERLITKQTALKCAVDFIKSLENEDKPFETLIEEVRTMTVHFYRIVVERNEDMV